MQCGNLRKGLNMDRGAKSFRRWCARSCEILLVDPFVSDGL